MDLDKFLFDSSDSSDSDIEAPAKRLKRTYREHINYYPYDNKFREQFRMTKTQFEILYTRIGHLFIMKRNRRCCMNPDQRMLNAIHWLAQGQPYHGSGDMHGVSKSTICRNVRVFVEIIIQNLFKLEVDFPNNPTEVAKDFYRIGKMPCVIGCVDGSHIEIDSPTHHEEQYVNRHGTHSINAMFVCGPDLRFYYVNANYPGSTHDSRVLRNSNLYTRFTNGWRPFPGAIILGDTGYFLTNWLIPSINDYPDDEKHKKLYKTLKSTRRLVECAIGVLKERFQCLHHLRVQPKMAAKIIIASATLHNFIISTAEKNEYEAAVEDDHDEGESDDGHLNGTEPGGKERLQQLLGFFE